MKKPCGEEVLDPRISYFRSPGQNPRGLFPTTDRLTAIWSPARDFSSPQDYQPVCAPHYSHYSRLYGWNTDTDPTVADHVRKHRVLEQIYQQTNVSTHLRFVKASNARSVQERPPPRRRHAIRARKTAVTRSCRGLPASLLSSVGSHFLYGARA